MQTPENQPQQPEGTGGFLVVIGAVVVSVLLAGVLAWTVLGRSETAVGWPTTIEPGVSTTQVTVFPADVNAPSVPKYVVIDQALTRWHDEQGRTLARILAMLSAPPAQTAEQLRNHCTQVDQIVDALLAGEQPPRQSVAELYTAWLDGLQTAADFCLEEAANLDVEDAVVAANTGLGSTGYLWQEFFFELALYVDLTR
jgi:hypothetical protein